MTDEVDPPTAADAGLQPDTRAGDDVDKLLRTAFEALRDAENGRATTDYLWQEASPHIAPDAPDWLGVVLPTLREHPAVKCRGWRVDVDEAVRGVVLDGALDDAGPGAGWDTYASRGDEGLYRKWAAEAYRYLLGLSSAGATTEMVMVGLQSSSWNAPAIPRPRQRQILQRHVAELPGVTEPAEYPWRWVGPADEGDADAPLEATASTADDDGGEVATDGGADADAETSSFLYRFRGLFSERV